MCGITGIIKFDRTGRIDSDVLRRMCGAMVHRGPDDEGLYVAGNVGLAMRRLSIIDLATGHQPLSNEDGSVWIVFNGEIYNQSELRKELKARKHHFRSNTDTEVIVHLYEEYGHECVHHLRGMFAFTIWDANRRTLFMARDRFGIKPLYYHVSETELVFASEIKVLFASEGIRPQFQPSVLPEYLAFGYLSGPETFYQDIVKLMPGHWLEIDESGTSTIQQYWDLSSRPHDGKKTESYYVEGYRELLEQAVRAHLMSDVPLGVFLSGGLDSSAVAALATRMSGGPIQTFSVGYREQKYSELPYAREVSKHLHSSHHEVLVSEEQFFDALPRVIWHEDEPAAWPSSVALYFLARFAQEHVKVVLTGEGSDETLAGYTRYAFTVANTACDRPYRRFVPSAIRSQIRTLIRQSPLVGADLRRKLSHTFLARDGREWRLFYFDNFFSAFNESEQLDLLHDDLAAEFAPNAPYSHVLDYWEDASGNLLDKLLYTDIKTYLVELLMKQDNMSMAASVESRVPFLDHRLVEFAATIPAQHQIHGLSGKHILKIAAEDLLPRTIVYRKKLGFPTPWSAYLSGPALEAIRQLLRESRSVSRFLFKPEAVDRLFCEHRAGYRDHADRIWRLLNLELWHRVCMENEISYPGMSYADCVVS